MLSLLDLQRSRSLLCVVDGLHLSRAGMRRREVVMKFLRPRQVVDMIGVSRTTLWRMVRAGTFPRPVRITPGSCGFLLETVESWIRARAEGSPWQSNEKQPGGREVAAGSGLSKLALARRP